MSEKTKKADQSALRARLRKAVTELNEIASSNDTIYKRQVDDIVDTFTTEVYEAHQLMSPPYLFSRLYLIYEQSDVLQECIDAMCENVDGFGYQLQFLGNDSIEQETAEVKSQYEKASNFFDLANDAESWMTIRKKMRKDFEVLGNGGFEVIRNRRSEIAMVYHIPFKTIRLTRILESDTPIKVKVKIKRKGKDVEVVVKKYFRRFAQVKLTGEKIRWFKSFGDPRIMNALTGEFVSDANGNLLKGKKYPKIPASEIIHFKNDFGGAAYGIPRWIGAVLDIIGRRNAQYVNYDLFNNQGIPPMIIMVSGGTLTDESILELENLVRGMRGASEWNKVALLESNPESVGLEEKGSAKIELKNMAEYRKDDQMFDRYLKNTEKVIRHAYRLPPLYVGASEAFTHSTSKNARLVAEEQVFIPERKTIDEFINIQIVKKELNITMWSYKTNGPTIVGSEEISKGVETFSKAGGFTINHAIEMANEAFGLQMSKFSEVWANYPVPIVLKLVELGRLNELDTIQSKVVNDANTAQSNLEKADKATKKIIDSEIFTKEEKALYKQLMTIQHAIVTREEN